MRPGVTLPELLLVAWLFGLVLAALAGFAGAQSRLVALTEERVRATDAVRTAAIVLGAELRALAAPDLAIGSDSIRLRAVRGGGPICGVVGRSVLVRYRGSRRPEPEKDSVLVVSEAESGAPVALRAVAASSQCGGALRLELDREVPAGLVLVFETGVYHLAGDALRYRRGAGGRQPLTEAVLSRTELRPSDGSTVVLSLAFDDRTLPRLVERETSVTLHLANGGLE